uniref:Uncharacterized protein n=1 Tax=Caenorhabditis japonica TaxID=281687 RepID=A0A8R1E7E3_CAEJA
MEDDGLGEFDFSSPLQFALSRLNGTAYHPTDDEVLSQMMLDVAEGREQEQDPYSNFPKPSSLSRIAEDEQAVIPRTTNEIIDELVENYDNYPKLVQIMMQRGFLKKKQECRNGAAEPVTNEAIARRVPSKMVAGLRLRNCL